MHNRSIGRSIGRANLLYQRSTERSKTVFLKVLNYILIFSQHTINSFYRTYFTNIFEDKSMCDTGSTQTKRRTCFCRKRKFYFVKPNFFKKNFEILFENENSFSRNIELKHRNIEVCLLLMSFSII